MEGRKDECVSGKNRNAIVFPMVIVILYTCLHTFILSNVE